MCRAAWRTARQLQSSGPQCTRLATVSPSLTSVYLPLHRRACSYFQCLERYRACRKPGGVSGTVGTYAEVVVTEIPYRIALIVGAGSGISASFARGLAA